MPTTLRWIASASASCLHAASTLIRGRSLTDATLAQTLAAPAKDLADEIAAAELPRDRFLDHLVALSAGIDSARQLVDVAITKTVGRAHSSVAQLGLVRRMAELESAFRAAAPGAVDEIELRSAPLREQWEARGPGLLKQVARLTEPELVVEQAEVVLTFPVRGGAGLAHLPYDSVLIEAVLANPIERLPEVARLGWLISVLNSDIPKYSETIEGDRLEFVLQAAMLPAALAAAEQVELVRADSPTISLAVESWRMTELVERQGALVEPSAASLAETLQSWWETYRASRPPWAVALSALDQMLK